jgi:hypothetical protein
MTKEQSTPSTEPDDEPTTEVERRRRARRADADRRAEVSPPPDGIDRRKGERRLGDRRKARDDPEE